MSSTDSDIDLSGDGDSESLFEGFPSLERVSTLLTQVTEFLSFR